MQRNERSDEVPRPSKAAKVWATRHPGTPVTDENLKLNPKDTLRICAEDIHEVMQYLKRWEPNFDIRSIRSTGLVVLLSGSPYQE
jgi:hypothetical protein